MNVCRRYPICVLLAAAVSCVFCPFILADSVVVFNEIMYHPQADEAHLEWIELYNQMAMDIDLSGWSIRGGIEYAFPQGAIIHRNSYLVVAIDPGALEADRGYGEAYGPFTGRLANTGEELRLLNNNDRVMDSVFYLDDGPWPVAPDGSGVSLAKYDPLSASGPASNWRPSSIVGGTPGRINFPSSANHLPEYDVLLEGGDPAKVMIPVDNSDENWRQADYEDASPPWTDAVTAVGFDKNDAFLFNCALGMPVINGSGAYLSNPFNVADSAGNFTALNVTDDSTSDVFGVTYWLGREGRLNEYFILDLQKAIDIKEIRLRNTHNTQYNDRGTADFEIWAANEVDANKQLVQPQRILSGVLTNVNGTNEIPTDVFTASDGLIQTRARFLKFVALTANNSGNNVGLNEMEVYGSTITTDIADLMSGKNATAYIRVPFDVANPLKYDRLTLGMQYDDGFAAYLNGVLVEQRNASAVLAWDSSATAENSNQQAIVFESFDISQHLGLLRGGQNVVAVHGLNLAASDSDFLICPRLTARCAEVPEFEWSIVINEVAPGGMKPFWVELYNHGSEPAGVEGFVLESSAGGRVVLSGTIAPGEYKAIDAPETDFIANVGDKLFVYTPNRLSVIDAVVVKERLRGRVPGAYASQLQYPAQATQGAVNLFALHDEVVINEVMYHHRPDYEQAVPTEYVTTTVVAFDAVWEYDESGDNLGGDWKEPAADFSHWKDGLTWTSGPGVLGNETAGLAEPIRTPLSLDGQTTYYFRKQFEFTGDVEDVTSELTMLIDDGAVFYLNGLEIYRHNMDEGVVNYLTGANPGVTNAAIVGPLAVDIDNLVEGVNFLAVEVHQQTPTSSDVVFGLQLTARQAVSQGRYVPYRENEQEWIELFNRSESIVDLSGWRLDEAVEYVFEPGVILFPSEYLVVASDAAKLASDYPEIRIAGAYSGRLSNHDERIVLLDANGNVADDVHYYDDGAWPTHADGGGSSLELVSPFADNGNANAWAHSDEAARSGWKHYTYTAAAVSPVYDPPIYFHEFVLGLLDRGEILLDNISVVENPETNPVELMQNVSFENDTLGEWPTAWRIQGTHDRSAVVNDPDKPGNKVLHLIADGPSNYLCNHAETTLANNRTVVDGNTYRISFDAKWIAGSPQLRTELYYCDVPKTTIIQTPSRCGTPGGQNSTYKLNTGPTFHDLRHEPLIPSSDDAVTVSISAADPDGIAKMYLWHSVNGGQWVARQMTAGPAGRYSASISPQSDRSTVQFYIAGRDSQNAQACFPAKGPGSRALYKVDNGFSTDPLRRDFRFIMTAADADFLHLDTNLLSNNRLGATVVYDNREVFYDVGVRLKGSMFSRTNINGVGYNIRFHPDQPFRGVHETITLRGNSRRELLPKFLINQSGGIPGMYDDIVRLTSPKGLGDGIVAMSMARYGDVFLESQYDNGKDGTVFKLEGIRVMQATVDGGPESLKIYMPVGWMPQFDITDLGDDKELYRWAYRINRNRAKDDYSRLMEMAKVFSLSGAALQQEAARALDMDVWMRQFALTSLCGIGDTYSQGNPHNLNFYIRPSDNRVLSMPWDWDFDFTQSATAPLWGNKKISRIISLPPYRRLFLGHMHDMINTTYNADYMAYWINHYSQIAGMDFSRVVSYINARSAHVLSLLPPEVPFEITTNGGADFSVDDDGAVLEGTGWINVYRILWTGSGEPLAVTWLDGETWQIVVPVEFGANSLTLTACDFRGNTIASDSITITSTVEQRPLRNSLRVSELMYDPIGGSDYEFIELHNIGRTVLDISEVDIVDAGSQSVVFSFLSSEVTALAPDEHVVIANDLDAFSERYNTSAMNIAGEFAGNLSNGGERLIIRGRHNAEILSFEYGDGRGWPPPADGAGHSLVPVEFHDQIAGSLDYCGNWRASSYIHGSPGQTDPLPNTPIVVNEINAHTDYNDPAHPEHDSNDWIELFNRSDAPVSIAVGTWYLSDNKDDLDKWAIPATTIAAGGIVSFDEVTGFHQPITSGFGLDKAGEEVFLSCLPGAGQDRVVDCIRFKSQAGGISLGRFRDGYDQWHAMTPSRDLPNLPPIEHVIIREFMYHPPANGYEYILLFNPKTVPVALWDVETNTGWRLDGGISYRFDASSIVPAGGYLLVAGFDLNEANMQGFIEAYGSMPATKAGPYSGVLANGGERIALEKPQASDDPVRPDTISWMVIDEVVYSDTIPWPKGADGLGKALHRKGVVSYGPMPAAWFAAKPGWEAACADLNEDGRVDVLDFGMLAAHWLMRTSDVDWNRRFELHDVLDGEINLSDLDVLAGQWLWTAPGANQDRPSVGPAN